MKAIRFTVILAIAMAALGAALGAGESGTA